MTDEVMIVDPQQVATSGQKASMILQKLVSDNKWAAQINGKSYLQVEAWQTIGKFYNYTARTKDVKYVEYGDVKGFTATSELVDQAGAIIGGAEADCLNDEPTWKNRPLHALKSMAQTRAVSKAYRQVLSWVAVMAGFEATPAAEMNSGDPIPMQTTDKPKDEFIEYLNGLEEEDALPKCPKCQKDMWDNRPKKASGEFSPKAPDFKCKDKECGGVIWPKKEESR